MDEFGNPLMHTNDFEFRDFIGDPNFDQFIDLIREENEDTVASFDCNLIGGFTVDNQFGSMTTPEDLFNFNGTAASTMASDLSFVLSSSFSRLNGDEEDNDEDDSPGTTTRTTTTKKSKVNRSETLISERKRRGRMKEKLYALRALVPNITKMDKASIVGDAVLYVKELQMKAKKLKGEIAGLEASLSGAERCQKAIQNPRRTQVQSNSNPTSKKIIQMDVFQVEERGFYMRLVCNKGEGVAVSLYKALESLKSFDVQNSNFSTLSATFVLTFTLNVNNCKQSTNLPNLKLWVTGALLNQGFELLA